MTQPISTDIHAWYSAKRRQGMCPKDAYRFAQYDVQAAKENNAALQKLKPSSLARIAAFVDDFIRSEDVQYLSSDRNSDFINQRDRADRVHRAAEHGAGGETHAEVIGDWRDAFSNWTRDRDRNRNGNYHDRFEAAVQAFFTSTELWHDLNGSLHTEVG